LLIGLGGGSLAMELKNMGFSVDAVELDRRVPEVARKYFGFQPAGVNVFLDDGRHYVRTADKKYDLVIIDVLNGEIQPYHMFTMESFAEIRQIMQPDGLLIVNNQGFLLGDKGLGARSIYKTMIESGFVTKYYFAGDAGNSGDIHFIASPQNFNLSFSPPERINQCCLDFPVDYHSMVITVDIVGEEKKLDLRDAEILTDDRPALTTLYNYSFEEWRSKALQNMLTNLDAQQITLFR
jgi:predicted membrane-bound spermidine synthase